MRALVYWNLHKKCWSIKALSGENRGRVVGHASHIDMACVEWKVNQSGWRRVLREKKKNVHAGAVGIIERWLGIDGNSRADSEGPTLHQLLLRTPEVPGMVTYNPYKANAFLDVDTGKPVVFSKAAFLCPDRRVYSYGTR